MTKSLLDQLDIQCSKLNRELSDLKVLVQVLQEKHQAQTQRQDSLKEGFRKVEQRLHSLEDFMLTSLQRLAFFKTLFKFWPVLLALLLFFFSIGVFVDDEKVAAEIRNKIEMKA